MGPIHRRQNFEKSDIEQKIYTMAISNQVLIDVTKRTGSNTFVTDPTVLLRNLLLFDRCVIRSMRLKEVEFIAGVYGFDAAAELLRSRSIDIHWNWLVVAKKFERSGEPPLAPLHFTLGMIQVGDPEQFIHGCLTAYHDIPRLSHKQIVRLKRLTVDRLVSTSKENHARIYEQIRSDFRAADPFFRALVDSQLKKIFSLTVLPEYELAVEEIPNVGYRVVTDLMKKLGKTDVEIHDVIDKALDGVVGFNKRVGEMSDFSALSGFDPNDAPILQRKLGALLRELDPRLQLDALSRVVEIADVPDINLATVGSISIPRLLEIRDTDECLEFRSWLPTIADASDAEIRERVRSLGAAVGNAIGSNLGKAIRFVISQGIGIRNMPLGVAVGAVDTFILEKLLPKSGPISFINHLYPSIFEDGST